jgi:CBS domain-containing protein
MEITEIRTRLSRIAEDLDKGNLPEHVTVRELLSWFNSQRRGNWISAYIRNELQQHGLVTNPDFQGAYIDETLAFEPTPSATTAEDCKGAARQDEPPDPTYRIGKLVSANTPPVTVSPDDTVEKAVSLMLTNDFSQLPVMTNSREVKGVISWSSLGGRLVNGSVCEYVRQCMDKHEEISSDVSLFAAIRTIVANQYVLVRNSHKEISGIVTTSDLSVQFQQLGEPFLLIGEIENYIRRMLQKKFTQEELAAVKDPTDADREVGAASDLSFGEYRMLLEEPQRWKKLGIFIDRKVFIEKLEEIRRIRNDVMHFDPDGIPDSDLKVLRDFVSFLQRLAHIKVI